MSRIGLKPITLPAGVEVKVDDKNLVRGFDRFEKDGVSPWNGIGVDGLDIFAVLIILGEAEIKLGGFTACGFERSCQSIGFAGIDVKGFPGDEGDAAADCENSIFQ